MNRPGYPHDRALLVAAIAYAFGYLLHSSDHILRGLSQTPVATFWTGTVGLLPAGFAIYLVYRRNEWAPFFAVVAGFWTAIGALAVHLPPHWSPLSEVWRGGLDWFDWGSLAMMVGGSLWFGVAGLISMRQPEASVRLGPNSVARQ
jgi:hypothetical protein